MKKIVFLTVAAVLVIASCATNRRPYSIPKKYKSYSETVAVPRLTAQEIYIKTYLWVLEQKIYWKLVDDEEGKQRLRSPQMITLNYPQTWRTPNNSGLFTEVEVSTENSLLIKTKFGEKNYSDDNTLMYKSSYNAWYYSPNVISFHIQNEQCQLVMSYDITYLYINPNEPLRSDPKLVTLNWVSRWKILAKEYRDFITAPVLPQAEIETLIANGNAAFWNNDFSSAEINFRKALQSNPFDADILAIYGYCFEQLYTHESEKWKQTGGAYQLHGDGYLNRLQAVLEFDNENLSFAMDMYNIALSIDPDNELAIMFARQNKLKQDANSDWLSQVNEEIEPLHEAAVAYSQQASYERSQQMIQQGQLARENARKAADEAFQKTLENLNTLASQMQQAQGSTGGRQTQAGASSGSSSGGSSSSGSSSGRNNNYDIGRARSSYSNYEDIARKAHGNAKTDYSGTSYGSFKNAQKKMKEIRRNAERNGYNDIDQSDWENASWPNN